MPATLEIKVKTDDDKLVVLMHVTTSRKEASDDEAALMERLIRYNQALLGAGGNLTVRAEAGTPTGDAILRQFKS